MQATIPSPRDAVPLESLLCVSCHWDGGSWCLTHAWQRWGWGPGRSRTVSGNELYFSLKPVKGVWIPVTSLKVFQFLMNSARVWCPRSLSSDAKVERSLGVCRWKLSLVYIERVEAEGALYGTCDHRPEKPQNTLRWYLFGKTFWFFFPFLSSLRPALRRTKIFYWKENIR